MRFGDDIAQYHIATAGIVQYYICIELLSYTKELRLQGGHRTCGYMNE